MRMRDGYRVDTRREFTAIRSLGGVDKADP